MKKLVAIAPLLIQILVIAPAHAQERTAACMSKNGIGSNGSKVTIMAPRDRVAELAQRGFVEEPCSGKERNAAAYRQKMCELGNRNEGGAQEVIRRLSAVSPRELCAMWNEAR